MNGSATLLRTIYSFQFAIIFYKVRYCSWAPTVSPPLRENWQKTFKYRGFCKTLLACYLESTGKGLLWKRKDLSINNFFSKFSIGKRTITIPSLAISLAILQWGWLLVDLILYIVATSGKQVCSDRGWQRWGALISCWNCTFW